MSGAKIVIIGAGPTALGAGYRLMELGALREYHQVFMFEQEDKPGGLARTVRDDAGFFYDLGGHVVFSHYGKFTQLLDETVSDWNHLHRESYVLMMDPDDSPRYVPYPIQHNLKYLSKEDQAKCLEGLSKLSEDSQSKETFEGWILSKFGSGLHSVFMKPYNQKIWTIDPSMMNKAWVGERVAVPSYQQALSQCETTDQNISEVNSPTEDITSGELAEHLKENCSVGPIGPTGPTGLIELRVSNSEAINKNTKRGNTPPRKKKGDSGWGPNRTFRFPKRGGTGAIWRGVSQKLPSSWIKYQYKVIEINISTKKARLLHIPSQERCWVEYDILISTMPLNLLLQSISGNDLGIERMKDIGRRFVYNAVHVVGIGLTGKMPEALKNKTWLYLPGKDCPFYRISIFSRYSGNHVPDPLNNWSLLCEASEVISTWKSMKTTNGFTNKSGNDRKREILRQAIPSLLKYGLIEDKNQVISIFHRRLGQGYPVPFLKRDKYLSIIQPWLESHGIYSRGRFGGWKYEVSNQDHSFMQGVEVIDRILLGVPEMTYYHPHLVNNGIDSGRYQPLKIRDRSNQSKEEIKFVSFRRSPDVTYVIAHYNEKLDWLEGKGISNKCHVYHKGGNVIPNFKVWKWEPLPNLGRETQTYLTYIINHYHCLPEIIIFLQGRIDDHVRDIHQDPTKYLTEARKTEISFKRHEEYDNWGRIEHNGIFLEKLTNGRMKKAPCKFGEFWKIMFGTDHPDKILINYSACFGVHRRRILAHPLSFYQKAISFVGDHSDPEMGHYFERLWYSIMTLGSRS